VTPERFELVESAFARAIEAPSERQDSVAQEACAGDVVVLENVRSLLDAHRAAGRFLQTPPSPREGEAFDTAFDENAYRGMRFGAYEAIEPIGAGGMGVVYRGKRSDDQYDKRVAIKLIHPWMDSREIHERFERERRLLAPLQHPNIAMLLDAGVSDTGAPYIVMEHVEGRPIDAYCRERRLGVEERLRLFLTVCDAVQAAHRALVAHLDIKPANILVTGDGHVKLVDFGVAQLLDARGGASAARAFTPAYAAPEQIEGGTLSAATDVYALGAVLYALLANVRPFATASEAARAIEETVLHQPPTPPSAAAVVVDAQGEPSTSERLRRRLMGDLDMIVLKAMCKDPRERYASPAALVDDIRRHLDGRTVEARPDTLAYRASRFVRRNRVAVVAAGIVIVSLAGGLAGVALQARAAETQRDRAEARFNDLRRLTNLLVTQVDARLADLPGSIEARREIMSESAAYLDSLSADLDDEPDLLLEVASSYEQLADLQRNMVSSDLGDTAAALKHHEKARSLRARALDLRPAHAETITSLATSAIRIGDMRRAQGDLEGAIARYREGAGLWDRAENAGGIAELDAMHNRAVALTKIGITHGMSGDLDAAQHAYADAHAINEAIIDRDPSRLVDLRNAAVTLEKQADIKELRGDANAAHELYLSAHERYLRLDQAEPNDARHIFSLAVSHSKLAEVLGTPSYANLGDHAGALEHYQRGRELITRLVEADPSDARAKGAAAFFDRRLGTLYSLVGEHEKALTLQLAAHASAVATAEKNPSDVRALSDVASTRMTIAETTENTGDRAGALEWRRRAIDTHRELLAINPDLAQVRIELAVALRASGDLSRALGDLPAARRALEECLSIYTDLERDDPGRSAVQEGIEAARQSLARCASSDEALHDEPSARHDRGGSTLRRVADPRATPNI